MKRQSWFKVAALAIAAIATLIGVELLATAFLSVRSHRYIPTHTRLEARRNTFIDDVTKSASGCRYIDTLFPHPYVAFVHHRNPPCGMADANNIGLLGPDYPSDHRADRFVVLVTGGSVAAQFMKPVSSGPSYLERVLERKYVAPNGRPVLLLNGGDGAGKQPQQLFLFLLYADAVDGVVTLDGFNEHYMFGAGLRFELPANNFAAVNPLLNSNYSAIVKQWMAGKLYAYAAANPLLSRSQAGYIALAALDDYLRRVPTVAPAAQRTTVESIFALPTDWDEPRRRAWALRQYEKYLHAMDAVASQQSVLAAHFIQPVPAIGKTLSDDEQRVAGDLGYAGMYQRMTSDLVATSLPAMPIVSLLDVFASHRETLYADPIHMRQANDGQSAGYELMAERIADTLARVWHLRAKS